MRACVRARDCCDVSAMTAGSPLANLIVLRQRRLKTQKHEGESQSHLHSRVAAPLSRVQILYVVARTIKKARKYTDVSPMTVFDCGLFTSVNVGHRGYGATESAAGWDATPLQAGSAQNQ